MPNLPLSFMSINLGIGAPPSLDSVSSGSRAFSSTTTVASNSTYSTQAKNPNRPRRHLNRVAEPQHDPNENIEQLRIRQSFSSTSFLSMRSLPSKLTAGNITKTLTKQKGKSTNQVSGGMHPTAKAKGASQKMKLFSHSSYIESDYNIKSDKVRGSRVKRCHRSKLCHNSVARAAKTDSLLLVVSVLPNAEQGGGKNEQDKTAANK